ncbi:MAG: ABC transporter ATP-binding protein [Lachnospiraceae bacterium]
MIQFQNFTFKYRTQKTPTIMNINLSILPGEKVLIVGPSGSGKSTLAHCINGLIPNSFEGEIQGKVLIEGLDPSKEGIYKISDIVGTAMQDTDSQFIGLTVAEDIAFAMENDCVPLAQMREVVASCAELVEVEQQLRHAPNELSGGQKQRVSIAGIMTEDAKVLLFDEPLANLDPATGKYAIQLIDKIHKETAKSIIIIEHRLEDVLFCSVDRIILVEEGKIKADMTPDQMLSSSLLTQNGIREPLYLAAIKYAGVELTQNEHPSELDKISTERIQKKVREWFLKTARPIAEIETEVILSIENLSYFYQKGEMVLKNISLQIRRGEMISIVGRNGAGKTTLSKLICGFLHPSEGIIRYREEDMEHFSIAQRADKVGLVMQNPNQMISKSMIFDEVALGLVSRGAAADEIKIRVEKILKICGLYPYRNWPIAALSYGQKKRVTIASILVLEPEILILDEPTAGQDYWHYTEIMEFIRELNQKTGITILMITHDMHLMLEYTDRTIVFSRGELIEQGRPAKILTTPETVEEANLKVTSLYNLAQKCGIEDVTGFAECFIQFDREVHENA